MKKINSSGNLHGAFSTDRSSDILDMVAGRYMHNLCNGYHSWCMDKDKDSCMDMGNYMKSHIDTGKDCSNPSDSSNMGMLEHSSIDRDKASGRDTDMSSCNPYLSQRICIKTLWPEETLSTSERLF